MTLPRASLLASIGVLLVLPLLTGSSYFHHLLVLWMLYALLALSLNIIVGYLGELSFGHAAFFGIGAYAAAILTMEYGAPAIAALLAAGLIAGLFGVVIGYVALRIEGPQFAILTLGFGSIIYTVTTYWVDLTRGPMGISNIPFFSFGFGLPAFESARANYYLVLGFVLVAAYACRALVTSRTGRAFIALRENAPLAASLGVDTFHMKLLGFVAATVMAGIAGALYAHYVRVITPELMSLNYMAALIIIVIVGGRGTVDRADHRRAGLCRAAGTAARHRRDAPDDLRGAADAVGHFPPRRPGQPRPPPAATAVRAADRWRMSAAQPLLDVSGLTRRFGGLVAVSDVTFQVAAGEIAGLIGPNGAGKTTLFNMLAGSMTPSGGRITFNGADCTGLPAQQMARLGVARTFQITSLFPGLTTLDNIVAASYRTGRTGWAHALLGARAYRQEEKKAAERARDILAFVDLDRHADVLADELSYGEQRRLEIAIALAAEPTLLLLDEPAAGMNPEEGQRLVAMIRQIRDRGVTVLLVEHHMRVVMNVCHRVIVIDHGVKIAEGAPEAIARHPEVIRVYLGREVVGA